MTPRLRPGGTALGLVLALALTGCASGADETVAPVPTGVDLSRVDPDVPGNGLWYLSPEDAWRQVDAAVRDARSATWSGRYVETADDAAFDQAADPAAGAPRTVDVTVGGTPAEHVATYATAAGRVTIVTTDGRSYLRGDEAWATSVGLPEAAAGSVCLPVGDPLVTTWQPLLSARELLEAVVQPDRVPLGIVEPVPGAPTVDLVLGPTTSPVGTLTVSATGAPLPVRLVAADDSGSGDFRFEGWGEPVDVAVPDDVVADCAG